MTIIFITIIILHGNTIIYKMNNTKRSKQRKYPSREQSKWIELIKRTPNWNDNINDPNPQPCHQKHQNARTLAIKSHARRTLVKRNTTIVTRRKNNTNPGSFEYARCSVFRVWVRKHLRIETPRIIRGTFFCVLSILCLDLSAPV